MSPTSETLLAESLYSFLVCLRKVLAKQTEQLLLSLTVHLLFHFSLFIVASEWPSYSSSNTLIGFGPISKPPKHVQKLSAMQLCPQLFLCT